MAKIQLLRVFLNQRLTAAAEEIFGAVAKTIAEYQEEVYRSKEENGRLQRQLDIVLKPPEIQLHRTDLQQLSLTVFEEEVPPEQQHCEQEWSPSLGQEDPEPTQIKEEQQEQHRTSQEEEFHNDFFIISSNDCVKSDYDQEDDSCQPSHLYQTQSEEYGQGASLPSTSLEQIKAEPDGEGYRVLELRSDSQPLSAVNPDCSPTPSEYREGVNEEEKEPRIRFKALKSKKAQKITSQSSGIWKKGRKSTESSHLNPHSQRLTAPCWCGVCGNKCYSVSFLIKHTREHTEDIGLDCLCGVCGKHFESKEILIDHLQTHMKNLFCHLCGQCFNWTSNLKRHMMIHTGERPHRCSDCGKGFRSSDCLTKHRRIHTGDKPFPCPVCHRGFNRRDNLKVHMRVHTGERPYMCSECYKCFATLTSLNKHQTMHNEERPYVCTDCGTRFKALESQRRHMKSVHNKKENTT
ncbi:zinc finger protein 391 [Coregonus clupeaformis]|uniref:zinc finger protein 391 n=1 Tax=Coregonus clupeaformis TaxID=59861 RepID=UPI001BDFF7E0|nr:zinc finger protein 391 [Coregonus clupeaformis]